MDRVDFPVVSLSNVMFPTAWSSNGAFFAVVVTVAATSGSILMIGVQKGANFYQYSTNVLSRPRRAHKLQPSSKKA